MKFLQVCALPRERDVARGAAPRHGAAPEHGGGRGGRRGRSEREDGPLGGLACGHRVLVCGRPLLCFF